MDTIDRIMLTFLISGVLSLIAFFVSILVFQSVTAAYLSLGACGASLFVSLISLLVFIWTS